MEVRCVELPVGREDASSWNCSQSTSFLPKLFALGLPTLLLSLQGASTTCQGNGELRREMDDLGPSCQQVPLYHFRVLSAFFFPHRSL